MPITIIMVERDRFFCQHKYSLYHTGARWIEPQRGTRTQLVSAMTPESADAGAAYFNSVHKYVVSTTLDKAEWNNSTLINVNIVEEITTLK